MEITSLWGVIFYRQKADQTACRGLTESGFQLGMGGGTGGSLGGPGRDNQLPSFEECHGLTQFML